MNLVNEILEAEMQTDMIPTIEHPLAESTSCSSEDGEDNINETSTENSEVSTDDDDEYEDLAVIEARKQWEESLVQLSQVLNWVVLPLLGKFFGRKAALWTWKWVANKLYH
ncbi:mitochondrial import protein 2 [Monosporozyma unispora]|nr:hypothetical protein C6P44_001798 [Kazachstania unispora]